MKSTEHRERVAVVGTGYWGKNLVRNFYQLGVLKTICDTSEDALAALTAKYHGVEAVQSYAEVLCDREIKGIVLATPAPTHSSLAREAILAGKDVYVEKPLCLTANEGRELNELAREHNRILMVGHLLWYHPAVLKLKELIDKGDLGRIQYIYSNRLNLGKLRREENVLWSFAPHDISVILGLVGEMPDSIQALGGNYLHQRIADTTVTLLGFPSGVKAHIFVSWLHPFKEQKLVVVGEQKMAVFNDTVDWPEKLALYPHSIEWSGNVPVASRAAAEYAELTPEEPLRAECLAFLECMATRRRPLTDGEEGLRVLNVLNWCQAALEKGTPPPEVNNEARRDDFYVHHSSVIDKDVVIGHGTKIWHFSHVLSGSMIGERCIIGQNVVIGPDAVIGNGCKIQNNVSIYSGVTLEDEVFCGPSMVFTNVFNPRAAVSRKNEFKKTLVCKGSSLGANCTIVCGVTIGRYAFVGAGAVVTKNVPDFALVAGNPARQIGWMSAYGERLDLPLTGEGEADCPHTGQRYRLCDEVVVVSENGN